MVSLPQDADSPPECPNCETDLLVERSRSKYHDWVCSDPQCGLLWDQKWNLTGWGEPMNKRERTA